MGLIKREVSGNANDYKVVDNGIMAPEAPAGLPTSNTPNSARGNIDSAGAYIGDTSFGRSFTEQGNRGSLTPQIPVAHENVTAGMGGKFIK